MSKSENSTSKTLKVDYLARVEGEGSLYLKIQDGKVAETRFSIFEPPRFFEAFLRGRSYLEAPDITARICGICPVAYQMSSVQAMEAACGVEVNKPIKDLRRLLYCGEWIESHALHVYMLHAPDFLGYPDVIAMARDHKQQAEKGLKMKKIGNDIVTLLGGREIHPINVRVGGFYKIPDKTRFDAMLDDLKWARDAAYQTVIWTSKFEFPDLDYDYEFVSLCNSDEYPMNEGLICSNKGLKIHVSEYEEHFREKHVSRSTSLHSVLDDERTYLTGPLARYNQNYDRLSPISKEAASEAGISRWVHNPFRSIVVRSIETLYAFDEAIRLIENMEYPDNPSVTVKPVNGVGHGCTEAPRGSLYHRYKINEQGDILEAKIVPPTSQNQLMIEDDLRRLAEQNLHLSDEELTHKCEQSIRNYDPCISCSTHYLKLTIDRD